jgi:hypothetical protein
MDAHNQAHIHTLQQINRLASFLWRDIQLKNKRLAAEVAAQSP